MVLVVNVGHICLHGSSGLVKYIPTSLHVNAKSMPSLSHAFVMTFELLTLSLYIYCILLIIYIYNVSYTYNVDTCMLVGVSVFFFLFLSLSIYKYSIYSPWN